MKKILYSIFNMGTTAILLIIFAISCGTATILESYYNTDTAWALVYNTTWFGAIQVLLGISLLINIFKYRIYEKKKLPSFLFHISFIFILIGAILTRYLGFEGSLHIRENSQNNIVSSRDVYIQMFSDEDGKTVSSDLKNVHIDNEGKNRFTIKLDVDGKNAILKNKAFIINGGLKWVESNSSDAEPVIELLFSDEKHKKNITLRKKDNMEVGDLSISFNQPPKQKKYIEITSKNGKFFIKTTEDITFNNMKTMKKGKLEPGVEEEFDEFNIYNMDGINFAATTLLPKAVIGVAAVPKGSMGNNAIIADLQYNGQTKEVFMFFGDNIRTFNVGGKDFGLAWGPKEFVLPFSLYLKKFNMQRYPGSNSPSGYQSDVIVKDGSKEFDYEIYMNHVLDYSGYRFFQSSYDKDEKGTILSVNRDPGKFPTYIGYMLLCFGMLLNFFNPNSRFRKLSRLIDQSNANKVQNTMPKKKKDVKISSPKFVGILVLLAVLFCSFSTLNASTNTPILDSQNRQVPYIAKEHAKKLASLVVQGFDGRMIPFDTAATDIMHKIYKKDEYYGLNANQVMLSMMINQDYWKDAKVIKVENDKKLKDILSIPQNESYAQFSDFFAKDKDGKSYYKLGKFVEEANIKPIGNRGSFDKDLLKVDERINIFYMVFMNELFKIIPKQDDPTHTWYTIPNAMLKFSPQEASEVSQILKNYFVSVLEAQEDGNWAKADDELEVLKNYQRKASADIIPSKTRLDVEIIFNKIKIFDNLTPIYLLAGFALLIFVFIRLLTPNMKINGAFKAVYIVNILAFAVHTIGLLLRWYIAQHAPWSNAYESMVYIAWALSLSGIIFSKRSPISLSLTSILAGITLFVAHLSVMDPQITNIQPVLKSYWLTIHVSVITASYGFLGLCALLGLFTLVLFIINKNGENKEITKNILEATRINEMSMILGLCLLTCGNFLGGVWANESWGRYWGWDSKETWSLVTILVYAAIVHFRFIPKANSQYWFAVASMFAYASVIMTYFGVNFYLTGMHSYAAGERIPIPNVVWISALILFIVAFISFFKRKYATKL